MADIVYFINFIRITQRFLPTCLSKLVYFILCVYVKLYIVNLKHKEKVFVPNNCFQLPTYNNSLVFNNQIFYEMRKNYKYFYYHSVLKLSF